MTTSTKAGQRPAQRGFARPAGHRLGHQIQIGDVALKIGGHLVILDHAATEGAGLTVTASLHRIDEQTVIQELTKVGFKLEAKSIAWRNAADTREVQSTKMETTSDRFALRFVKP